MINDYNKTNQKKRNYKTIYTFMDQQQTIEEIIQT